MATVSLQRIAVRGAGLRFRIIKPNGSVTAVNAVTGWNGAAGIWYRLLPRDPLGAYTVQVDANYKGTTGTATTSFTAR
jgi:hypothetical protein